MKANVFLFSLFLCLLPLKAQEQQSDRLLKFVTNINAFSSLNPHEKVYLHIDNTGYFIGDTIWFKAYVVNSMHNQLTDLSKVLYVELLSQEGEVIITRKLKMKNGQCYGEFPLSHDCRSGFYEIRSYTRAMLNFGEGAVFSRVIPVYKALESANDYAFRSMNNTPENIEYKRIKAEKFKNINISFYPEGGYSVIGLRSKIAFKVTGKRGEPINIGGEIYNQSNQLLSTFKTIHQGMGVFEFIPRIEKCKVVVQYEGKKYDFDLPESLPSGYILSVNNQNSENILIKLQKSANLPVDSIGVSVSSRGKIYAFNIIQLSDKSSLLEIAKDMLPAGCTQITVFNSSGEIFAERLIFINRAAHSIPIRISRKKGAYSPLEKIEMDFTIKDNKEQPIETIFSLAIRDAKAEIQTAYRDNINTYLLLSSEIKGEIENPFYYFEKDDRDRRIFLDLLMMVQGWKRYDWKIMAGVEPFNVKHHAEEGLLIKGEVKSLFRKKIKVGTNLMFWMMKDGQSHRGSCLTNEEGKFVFLVNDSIDIRGKWHMGLQTTENGKRKDNNIMLDRVFSPKPRKYNYLDLAVNDSIVMFVDDEKNDSVKKSIDQVQTLREFVIQKRKYTPDVVYNVEKDINERIDRGESYPARVQEYLEEKDRKYWFKDVGKYQTKTTGSTMYGINGSQLTFGQKENGEWSCHQDYDYLHRFRGIDEVEKIVMTTNPKLLSLYSVRHPIQAHFYVYAYKDKTWGKRQKGIRHTYFEGFSYVADFYHPNHKDPIPGDVDYRRTLYWNPNLTTDATGMVTISFYNNISCRTVTISAEGITSHGIPVVYEN